MKDIELRLTKGDDSKENLFMMCELNDSHRPNMNFLEALNARPVCTRCGGWRDEVETWHPV
jgi:hypothetical protein